MAHIFISHSHDDEGIAGALVAYLETALKLDDEYAIRCTSVPGHQLPFGQTIASQIKSSLEQSSIFIMLITQRSLLSSWVMFETGAAWVLGRTIVPILGPNIEINQLPGATRDYPVISVTASDAQARMADLTRQIALALKLHERTGGGPANRLRLFLDIAKNSVVLKKDIPPDDIWRF